MKYIYLALFACALPNVVDCAQENRGKLSFPSLDAACQTNIVVSVFGDEPCPPNLNNSLTNRNLFEARQQKVISEALVKYQEVTTNIGPKGTLFESLSKTNYTIKARGGTVNAENWIVRFIYTNSAAYEQITIGKYFSVKYRTGEDQNGYNLSMSSVGGGTLLTFTEIKHEMPNGLRVDLLDTHSQGTNWDYRRANFSDPKLSVYTHLTNNLTIGDYFLWDPKNGNLILQANFKAPVDMLKHHVPPLGLDK